MYIYIYILQRTAGGRIEEISHRAEQKKLKRLNRRKKKEDELIQEAHNQLIGFPERKHTADVELSRRSHNKIPRTKEHDFLD